MVWKNVCLVQLGRKIIIYLQGYHSTAEIPRILPMFSENYRKSDDLVTPRIQHQNFLFSENSRIFDNLVTHQIQHRYFRGNILVIIHIRKPPFYSLDTTTVDLLYSHVHSVLDSLHCWTLSLLCLLSLSFISRLLLYQ